MNAGIYRHSDNLTAEPIMEGIVVIGHNGQIISKRFYINKLKAISLVGNGFFNPLNL